MAHPYHHALSSHETLWRSRQTTTWTLHAWFDATKAHIADARHRCLRHQSLGIFIAEQKFGVTLTNSSQNQIPIRPLAEQHVQEDFSFIPSVRQCFENLPVQRWMLENYDCDTPSVHARWSVKQFGGKPEDYLPIHQFLEDSRLHLPDARHRVLLHTTLGVQTVEEVFGLELSTSDSTVPTRLIAEKHIIADLGFIPSIQEAFDKLPLEPWMFRGAQALTRTLGRKVPRDSSKDASV